MSKKSFTRELILYETAGFGIVILFLWADEIFDLPHYLLGAEPTPVNWVESCLESGFTFVLCIFTITFTSKLLKHIKYLEGFLPVCSFCKRIRVNHDWIPIEDYISNRSEAVFSHGLCPRCAKEHYPEIFAEDEEKPDGHKEKEAR